MAVPTSYRMKAVHQAKKEAKSTISGGNATQGFRVVVPTERGGPLPKLQKKQTHPPTGWRYRNIYLL